MKVDATKLPPRAGHVASKQLWPVLADLRVWLPDREPDVRGPLVTPLHNARLDIRAVLSYFTIFSKLSERKEHHEKTSKFRVVDSRVGSTPGAKANCAVLPCNIYMRQFVLMFAFWSTPRVIWTQVHCSRFAFKDNSGNLTTLFMKTAFAGH